MATNKFVAMKLKGSLLGKNQLPIALLPFINTLFFT